MVHLTAALHLLQEKFGPLDNIKFMLGSTDGKSSEEVEVEILRIAQGIKSGEYAAQASLGEDALRGAEIAL